MRFPKPCPTCGSRWEWRYLCNFAHRMPTPPKIQISDTNTHETWEGAQRFDRYRAALEEIGACVGFTVEVIDPPVPLLEDQVAGWGSMRLVKELYACWPKSAQEL